MPFGGMEPSGNDENKIVLTAALPPTPECRLLCETRQSLFTE
jgi:hypothetical protein